MLDTLNNITLLRIVYKMILYLCIAKEFPARMKEEL